MFGETLAPGGKKLRTTAHGNRRMTAGERQHGARRVSFNEIAEQEEG
jgi:hypothetical protein